MGRHLFNIACLLALVISAASTVLWTKSLHDDFQAEFARYGMRWQLVGHRGALLLNNDPQRAMETFEAGQFDRHETALIRALNQQPFGSAAYAEHLRDLERQQLIYAKWIARSPPRPISRKVEHSAPIAVVIYCLAALPLLWCAEWVHCRPPAHVSRSLFIASAISLALVGAIAVLWMRTYVCSDSYHNMTAEGTGLNRHLHHRYVTTFKGGFGGAFLSFSAGRRIISRQGQIALFYFEEQVQSEQRFGRQWTESLPQDFPPVKEMWHGLGGKSVVDFDGVGHAGYTVFIPFWLLAALLLILPSLWRSTRLRHPIKSGHCLRCGYDLRASPEHCPECGAVTVGTPTRQANSTVVAARA